MKNLREIIDNRYIKVSKKINDNVFEFYAFIGYKPIIRELILTNCNMGNRGCFKYMFIEKDKPKAIAVIRNKKEIETVAYLIEDSWIIGNVIPEDKNHLGNLGFFTRPEYRGKGNIPKICKFFEEQMSKLHNMRNYHVYIQDHVANVFSKYFKKIKVEKMRFGENSSFPFFDETVGTQAPFSIDLKKEMEKIMSW